MFSFRKKIFISYLAVFLIFIALLTPLVSKIINKLLAKAMEDRAIELIEKIRTAPSDEGLIRRLKDQKSSIFFRVSLITDERKVLYDSHTKRLLGPRFSQDYVVNHPEVFQALREGIGFHEGYSELLNQKFVYMAKAFDFHGKKYVLRTAFPYEYISELTHDFAIGFVSLATMILLLFSTMTWFIINHLTKPIQRIINVVKPYQEGLVTTLPEIDRFITGQNDEFGKLARTLNSLSQKVQHHIDTITEERNEKKAILESLVEGVVAIDDNMDIIYANRMAAQLLGLKKDKLLGRNFAIAKQDLCFNLLARCQQENQILTETITLKHEDKKYFLDIVAAPKREGTGAILVLQDKTQQYKILEMRKGFIANASHELKTPITIIQGFAEALHENPSLPQKTTGEITEKILRNCRRMTVLIKDLLTLTDIEHIPETRLFECELVELVQTSCNTVHDIFPDAQIDIINKTNQPVPFTADPNLMEMAIINLVKNAAKYSPAPAQITITIDKTDEGIKLDIADKGIGIPKEELEKIFRRFYRVNRPNSIKKEGSGLGLSIVETIIDKHFGKISVKSEEDHGTTFTILLPHPKG